PSARTRLLKHLTSEEVVDLPEEQRTRLWDSLSSFVLQHNKSQDAEWSLKGEALDEVIAATAKLAPRSAALRHLRLFADDDFRLYEENGDYDEQHRRLEERRQGAVEEVLAEGGIVSIFSIIDRVEAPWRVGMALGAGQARDVDGHILPDLIDS